MIPNFAIWIHFITMQVTHMGSEILLFIILKWEHVSLLFYSLLNIPTPCPSKRITYPWLQLEEQLNLSKDQ